MDVIRIRGARTHNLRGIDLDLPRDRLIVITGLSGSGKSSLAFDTIYAEGQRRYVESLSAYARQFLSVMEKPDVDHIEGLSPAIAIEQKATSHNPRSTVGTVTEIYDYLRVLYARAGLPRCPEHGQELTAQTVSQMVDQVLALPEETSVLLLAPVVQDRKGEHLETFEQLRSQGFVRALIDRRMVELETPPSLDARRRHSIDVVVDRLRVRRDAGQRLAESFETALALSQGVARVAFADDPGREALVFSNRFACTVCGYSLAGLEPRLFSFNNPTGACGTCGGLGVQEFFDPARVVVNPGLSLAGGAVRGWDRRNAYYFQLIQSLARHFRFDIETPWHELPEAVQHVLLWGSGEEKVEFRYFDARGGTTRRSHPWEGILPNLERRFARPNQRPYARSSRGIAARARAWIATAAASTSPRATCSSRDGTCRTSPRCRSQTRAVSSRSSSSKAGVARSRSGWCARSPTASRFLSDVGLDYLALDRSAETLSGGEAQRIRLASQIGSGLVGVMYILDEPSIGLHQRDNQRLLDTLIRLRDLGNTVLVVEHDEDAIRQADYVVDLGPGAGVHGGEVVARGTPEEIANASESLTGQYLSGRRSDRGPARAHSRAARTRPQHRRGDRQQPAVRHRGYPARSHDLRHRRVRVRQIDAGRRHAVPPCGSGAPGIVGRRRARPGRRGTGADRPRDRHRSEPDRPHAALEPRNVYGPVRADPRALCRSAGVPGAWLRPGPLQLQRARWPLRGLRGRWRHPRRDALPARRVRDLRCLPRHALQPRDARDPLQGAQYPRSSRDDRGRRRSRSSATSRRCRPGSTR